MANLIALDWDTHELRAVVARSSSTGITVTDAVSVSVSDDSVESLTTAIRKLIEERGLTKAKLRALVTIGRGKAELRQLNLPPVPENELPDMVRLQAVQTFAAVGETTVVDFLPLPSSDETTSVLAAAVAPATIKSVTSVIAAAGLELGRIALRPVAASALYQIATNQKQSVDDSSIVGDVVLVDLLADDAEIVVLRGRRVMFVRTVRLPPESSERPAQVAGELRRSLMACGINTSSTSQKVIIWGDAKTHDAECKKLAESLGCRVRTIDPLSLVQVDAKQNAIKVTDAEGRMHTGRLAPLIGLLVADAKADGASGSPFLVDFVNPRRAVVVRKDHRKPILIGAAVAVSVLGAGYLSWSKLRTLDEQIENREVEIVSLKPQVAIAQTSIDRTELVDKFLDGNVIWLNELHRIAKQMPPAKDSILKSVSAVTPPREGGGRVTLGGAAISPVIVDELASSLRDETHVVSGTGASDLGDKETYRWGFRETVIVGPASVREQRYTALAALRDTEAAASSKPVSDDQSQRQQIAVPTPSLPMDVKPTTAARPTSVAPPAAAEVSVTEKTESETTPASSGTSTETPGTDSDASIQPTTGVAIDDDSTNGKPPTELPRNDATSIQEGGAK